MLKNNVFSFLFVCSNQAIFRLCRQIFKYKTNYCIPEVISVFAILFCLSGCKEADVKQLPKKQVVIFSNVFSKHSEKENFVNNIVEPLSKKMGIKINYHSVEGVPGIKDMEARSNQYRISADIDLGPFGTMLNLIKNDYLVNLSEKTKFWKTMTVLPAFHYGANAQERKYFMPIIGNIYIVIANKKALPYLPKGADINNLTWDQFADWAINMKSVNGYGRTVLSGVSLNSFIYQFGACALSYGAKFPEIDSEGAKKAWKIFEKIANANAFVPNIRIVSDCSTVMLTHQAWLSILNNAKACEVYAGDPDSYVLASMPTGSAGRGSIVGFSGMGVMKNSKNMKLALKILEYFSKPKVQIEVARETGGFFPASKDALKYLDAKRPEDVVIRKAIQELNSNIIMTSVPSQNYVKWEAVKQLFDNIFQNIILPRKKLTDIRLAEAEKELELLKK